MWQGGVIESNAVNIFLIGYRGSGKTSVARALAGAVGWAWVDADEELERRAGKSIQRIFAESGEGAFRDLESAVVADLAKLDGQIVALGGGAVLRGENRAALAGRGKIVWLRASPETLHERIATDPTTGARRPNLTGQGGLDEIRQLLAEREPIYRACADLVLDAEHAAPDNIATQIAAALHLQAAP
jgi:shikimate kinase